MQIFWGKFAGGSEVYMWILYKHSVFSSKYKDTILFLKLAIKS